MAQRGDAAGAAVPASLYGPRCLCDGCTQQGRCRDYNLHARDAVFAWINGFECDCSEYQPVRWRGLEGVRP